MFGLRPPIFEKIIGSPLIHQTKPLQNKIFWHNSNTSQHQTRTLRTIASIVLRFANEILSDFPFGLLQILETNKKIYYSRLKRINKRVTVATFTIVFCDVLFRVDSN